MMMMVMVMIMMIIMMTQIEKPGEGMYAPLLCSLSTFFEQVSSVP